jgi:hypothetical protein
MTPAAAQRTLADERSLRMHERARPWAVADEGSLVRSAPRGAWIRALTARVTAARGFHV